MTALEKYTRLEALGQWQETPDMPPKEVVVSFGKATLVLSDLNENPLGHWAMAATFPISIEGDRAIYTPDTEGHETLEINDAQMIEAIAQVSLAATSQSRKTPWLRWVFVLILVVAVTAAFKATPDLLRDQALRMTGPESARKIGTDMVGTLDLPLCREPRADAARELLQSRGFPEKNVLLMITSNDLTPVIFPGNIILIGNEQLRAMQSPNALHETMKQLLTADGNAVDDLFHAASSSDLFGYVTSGTLPEAHLSTVARNIITGGREIGLHASSAPSIIRDQDWVALQGICLD